MFGLVCNIASKRLQKFAKTGDESDDNDENLLTAATATAKTSRDVTLTDSDSDNEDNAMLAKPEFHGMWDSHKPYKAPKGDVETGPKMPGASKMEKVSSSTAVLSSALSFTHRRTNIGSTIGPCTYWVFAA